MTKYDNTLLLAHYYSPPEVKDMADFVGDSLELTKKAVEENPKRIVFAAVRFMAETVKLMLPDVEVVLPHSESTCSLVTQTNLDDLKKWRDKYPDRTHVMYINSSVNMKALADVIVTSSNASFIVEHELKRGNKILWSPDRNMGNYFNSVLGYDMEVWSSVCEVHDKFKEQELEQAMRGWTDGPKFLIAHPESILPVLRKADFVGSTSKMLNWVKEYPHHYATIFVATEYGLIEDMRLLRPDLDIRSAPTYDGCKCSLCPYMKKNTIELVTNVLSNENAGIKIDYIDNQLATRARLPIERMLELSK